MATAAPEDAADDAPADALGDALGERGIGAKAYYRVPVHAQPVFAQELDLPGTAEAARTHLAIPMGPGLTDAQVDEVVEAIRLCASGST